MGEFNLLEHGMSCQNCGESTNGYQFKYGSLGHSYRLGDKLKWLDRPASTRGTPDRKVRYVELSPSSCSRCGTTSPASILIVRNNIISAIYPIPVTDIRADASGAVLADFKPWEMMLLYNQYGVSRVWRTNYKLIRDARKASWPDFVEGLKAHLLENLNTKPDATKWMRQLQATLSRKKEAGEFGRDVMINVLAGLQDVVPNPPINFVDHNAPCPSCANMRRMRIPFLYGPCNGYTYRMGEAINWGQTGHLLDVRDPELHYIEIYLPVCDSCKYQGVGMVTVEFDKITDIFIWPRGGMELAESPIGKYWKGYERLDAFLLAREFSVRVFLDEIEKVCNQNYSGDFLENLATNAKRVINWSGLD